MKELFPKAWFATEQHFNSRTRLINFSDRGSLSFESGILQFNGRKQSTRIKNIQSIDITNARVPWISLALVFVALIIWTVFISSIYEETSELTPMFILFLIVFLAYMILVQKTMLWIEVVFRDDESVLRRAYFSYGSGWGAILGGTLGMYKKIKSLEGSAG